MAAGSIFVSTGCSEKGGRRCKERPGHEKVMCPPQQFGPCTVSNEKPLNNCKWKWLVLAGRWSLGRSR